ncbi:L-threonylcarbamoyladenylate synthase [Flavobacteriaceae bacterium F08102]|nr:L-threonylcarbamoyladenylate synthase [Flavobacteriaceae bacterium F08102]
MTANFTTEVALSLECLNKGGLLLYPTDTVWGLGCDATQPEAVAKVFKAKNRLSAKSLVILVSDQAMLRTYVKSVRQEELDLLAKVEVPTTLIYNDPIGLANQVVAENNTVAIRIPNHEFCSKLIRRFGRPIVSTSANLSGTPTPKSFNEINPAILEASDYVVNLDREKVSKSTSRILSVLTNGRIEVIRG